MKRITLLLIVSLLCFVNAAIAVPSESSNYKMTTEVTVTAGGIAMSGSYVNHGVLGQGMPVEPSAATEVNLPGVLYAANATLDADGDLLANLFDNCWHMANGGQENFDNDAWGDVCDPDDDNDQLSDAYELRYQLNPFDASDAANDNDGDSLSNLAEALAGSDPTRIGLLLPGHQLPQHIAPLLLVPEKGALDGQRPLPR